MPKDKRDPPKRPHGVKRSEFKPNMRSATAIVSAIAFLQKVGFQSTIKNIKKCISQRCRKPVDQILDTVPQYLSRGIELGILKKHGVIYKLGTFDLKTRRKKSLKKSSSTGKKQNSVESDEKPAEAVVIEPVEDNGAEPLCAF